MIGYDRELRVAQEAAALAASRIRADYERFVAVSDAPVSISTETDRGSQEIILKHLRAAFPDDALCAEEATDTLAACPKSRSRVWVVDPIDGTRGFVMKNGEFSVMIGLIDANEVVLGVVVEPTKDRSTFAVKGGGCWTATGSDQPRRCRVSDVTTLASSALIQSHSKKAGERSDVVKSLNPERVIEVYSAGVKLAMVARGEGELYLNTYSKFHDWDICAGHLLVTEAGGLVTTLHGPPITYGLPDHSQHGGLLATNGAIHEQAVAILKATFTLKP